MPIDPAAPATPPTPAPATAVQPPVAAPAPYTPPSPQYQSFVAPMPGGNQPPVVQVPVEQFQALTAAQTRLMEIERERQRDVREAATKEAEMKAQQGQLAEALALLRQQKESEVNEVKTQLNANEERTRHYALDSELSRVLAGYDLVPGTLPQLTTLLRPNLNVIPEGGSYKVQTPTFQDAASYVKEILAQPNYQIYLKATSQGGTGGSSGAHHQAPNAPPAQPVDPGKLSLGQAAILDSMAAMKAKEEAAGANVPNALNMAVPFGLPGKRRQA